MARYLKFKEVTFYNHSVFRYNLHDKQSCLITGYGSSRLVENHL